MEESVHWLFGSYNSKTRFCCAEHQPSSSKFHVTVDFGAYLALIDDTDLKCYTRVTHPLFYRCFVPIIPATAIFVAINMSDTLILNCWALGDDPRRVFSVKIAKSETVDALKKAIKDETKHTLDGIDAHTLDLWKVRISC